MNIEETVEQILAEFEKDKNAANYIWGQAYERALTEIDASLKARSVAFAHTVLYGRRLQLRESPDSLEAKQETVALDVAIQRLRSLS
jgi:hypothetical protein